jgi:hypothetical protein
MTEDRLRAMGAIIAAHDYILSSLVQFHLFQFSGEDRVLAAARIIAGSKQTDQLTGIARGDEAAAEYLADMTVRMQTHVERLVQRSLATMTETGPEAT